MNMQEKIIQELKRNHLGNNDCWSFKSFYLFYGDLSPVEQKEFDVYMDDWCQDGYFVKEKDGSVFRYRLTEKGEQMIWKN